MYPLSRIIPLALLLGVFSITGCDTNSVTDGTMASVQGPTSNAHIAAVYEARLRPLNASVNGQGVTGIATFTVGTNGMLTAEVDAKGLAVDSPLGIHAQHIHAGSECPNRSDDTNGDKIVDVIEGVPVYGAILVPLDGDISNTTSEIPTFPSAMSQRGRSAFGEIDYEATASVAAIEAALGGELSLDTRHVVLHGISASTELPESVQSLGGLPPQVSIPVACGEIRRVQ